MGLRRDGVGADDLGPAERDGLGHRVRSLDLLEHRGLRLRRTGGVLLRQDEFVGFHRRADIGGADLAGKRLLDRAPDAVDMDEPGQGGKGAEQGGIRHRASDMFQRQFGCRHDHGVSLGQPIDGRVEVKFGKALVGVDEQIPVAKQAGEHIDHLEQGRILDDQAIRLEDGLTQADRLVGNPAEGDDRRAGALRSKTGEGLGVASFAEGGDRKHLGSRDYALSAATVNSNLKHWRPSTVVIGCNDRLAQWQGSHLAFDQTLFAATSASEVKKSIFDFILTWAGSLAII
ncbi:hypothetical protein BRAS3843_1470044 [Bradyrhizobium sp. STM 3843]|nr:hypothetical protein BRAS3843_1470044 [Bradyrhizobium sp. STM 3843]